MTAVMRDKIVDRLDYLRERITELRDRQKNVSPEEYRSDRDKELAIERLFHVALEAVIDIASFIVTEQDLQKDNDERSKFIMLADADILERDLAEKLVDAGRFRNVLVHEYTSLEKETIYNHLQYDLSDLEDFAKAVAGYLKG